MSNAQQVNEPKELAIDDLDALLRIVCGNEGQLVVSTDDKNRWFAIVEDKHGDIIDAYGDSLESVLESINRGAQEWIAETEAPWLQVKAKQEARNE